MSELLAKVLDKVSRLTRNPDLAHFPMRCVQQFLRGLYRIGVYRLPRRPVLRGFDGDMCLRLHSGEILTRRLWFMGLQSVRRGMVLQDIRSARDDRY